MFTKVSKISLLGLLLIFPVRIVNSCGWSPTNEQLRFYTFQALLPEYSSLYPFMYSASYDCQLDLYAEDSLVKDIREQNVDEWYGKLNGAVSKQDIDFGLYELDANVYVNTGSADSPFVMYLKEHETDLFRYFHYLKCNELLISEPDPWSFDYLSSVANQQELVNALMTIHELEETTKDEWLKRRLAFQSVRMSYYTSDFARADSVCGRYFFDEQPKDWIWAQAHFYRAQLVDNSAMRNLEFARVFDANHERSNRIVELFDRKEGNMIQALGLAENNKERATLLTIYSMRNAGRGLDELKRIQSYDPNCKWMEFLLMRELGKLEDWLYTTRYSELQATRSYLYQSRDDEYWWYRDETDRDKLIDAALKSDVAYAKQFDAYLANFKFSDPKRQSYVTLVRAHLALLLENGQKAEALLNGLGRLKTLPRLCREQVAVDRIMVDLVNNRRMTNQNRERYMQYMEEHPITCDYTMSSQADNLTMFIAKQLEKYNHGGEAFLLFHCASGDRMGVKGEDFEPDDPWSNLLEKANPADCDEAFALINTTHPTRYQKFLQNNINQYNWWYGDTDEKDETVDTMAIWRIMDIKSSMYIQRQQWDNALACLKDIPDAYWSQGFNADYCNGNPFIMSPGNIPHSVEMGKSVGVDKVYNKKTYLKELIRLMSEYKRGKHDNGWVDFQIGNALLGLHRFGEFWFAGINYNETLENPNNRKFMEHFKGGTWALPYFESAISNTKDRELAVLAFWGARFCKRETAYYFAEKGQGDGRSSWVSSHAYQSFGRKFSWQAPADAIIDEEFTDCGVLEYYMPDVIGRYAVNR